MGLHPRGVQVEQLCLGDPLEQPHHPQPLGEADHLARDRGRVPPVRGGVADDAGDAVQQLAAVRPEPLLGGLAGPCGGQQPVLRQAVLPAGEDLLHQGPAQGRPGQVELAQGDAVRSEGVEELGLAAVVLDDQGRGDARRRGDVADGHALVPVLAEEGAGGGDDRLTAVGSGHGARLPAFRSPWIPGEDEGNRPRRAPVRRGRANRSRHRFRPRGPGRARPRTPARG